MATPCCSQTGAEPKRRPRAIRGKMGGVLSSYAELNSCVPLECPRERRRKTNSWKAGLYPCEVVPDLDIGPDQCRVHFIGWHSKYDEIREKKEVVVLSSPVCETKLASLLIRIKENLCPSLKDTKVSIKIDLEEEDFDSLKAIGTIYKVYKSKTVYALSSRVRADQLFGCGWDYRIINQNADNFYIKTSTVRFYLQERKPLTDFLAFPDHVEENHLQRGTQLTFSFVKIAGNIKDLHNLVNNDQL